MSRVRGPSLFLLGVAVLSFAGCRAEPHTTPHAPVEPPVASPKSIPDAALFGTIRGQAFTLQDARYVADHRDGFAQVDIKLSAGKSEAACDDIKPAGSTSVWLRLEGSDNVASQDFKLMPGDESRWSVHYQVHGEGGWVGSTEGAAVVSLREAGPDGKITGGIAVCFADDMKSCVSGSFSADPCPYRIDAPARGALPPEAIPEKYKQKLKAAPAPTDLPAADPTGAPTASPTAAPSAVPTAAPTTAASTKPAPAASASAKPTTH